MFHSFWCWFTWLEKEKTGAIVIVVIVVGSHLVLVLFAAFILLFSLPKLYELNKVCHLLVL